MAQRAPNYPGVCNSCPNHPNQDDLLQILRSKLANDMHQAVLSLLRYGHKKLLVVYIGADQGDALKRIVRAHLTSLLVDFAAEDLSNRSVAPQIIADELRVVHCPHRLRDRRLIMFGRGGHISSSYAPFARVCTATVHVTLTDNLNDCRVQNLFHYVPDDLFFSE